MGASESLISGREEGRVLVEGSGLEEGRDLEEGRGLEEGSGLEEGRGLVCHHLPPIGVSESVIGLLHASRHRASSQRAEWEIN